MKITLSVVAATTLLVSGTVMAHYVAPITHTHGVSHPIYVKYVELGKREADIKQQMNSVRSQRQARSKLIQMKADLVRVQRHLRNHHKLVHGHHHH